MTFDNTTSDVSLDHTTLTLDSSIVSTPIDLVGGNGACDITFSRGPSGPSTNGCGDFDTNAAPQFVDPLTGDYHLQSSSPLIDVGNPADPGSGALDFYGDPRDVQGAACDAVRRDVGASEFQPSSPPQCAQDTYADVGTGDDSNNCLSPASACETIAAALSKSAGGQTTFVADGTYAELLLLQDGRSLQALDSSDPRPIVDGGSSNTPITVDSSGAGTVSGLRILSGYRSMDINGTVTVDDDVFDADPTSDRPPVIAVEDGSSVVINNNSFVDPDASGYGVGILLLTPASPAPVISNNTFDGLAVGIAVLGNDPRISGNQFSGAHPLNPSFPGAGIIVGAGHPTIDGNTFGAPSEHPSDGVFVFNQPPPAPPMSVGADLSHNRISGSDVGVQVIDSNMPVTLNNDLIYDNTTGVESTDTSADSPPSTQGDVSATNETIFDNAVDASVSYTTLTLDSTILGTPIDVVGNNGACSITYSGGSSASSNGCGNFDTSADPQFVDAASGNYQLQSTSPLIDIGDPASPGPGAVDFYGGPRELQGKQCSTVRRDIGAAEYDPGTTPGCPPPPSPPAPTPTLTPDPPAAPKINKQPDKRSDDTSPTFKFSSNVPGSTFRCKLDYGPYKACSSPKTYRGLDVGKHIFRVYAIDPSGNKGNPRVIRFTVTK